MATILMFTSGLFCLRPFTWILSKIFRNPRILGILLEFFYLGLAIAYSAMFWAGVFYLSLATEESIGAAIALLLIGAFGTFGLNYGILHYHKTEGEMSSIEHDGYDATIDYDGSNTAKVKVTERTKHKLSGDAFLAVLLSPLNPVIRFFNLLYSFRTLANHDYVCDLAIGVHPEAHGGLRTICVDTVRISDYDL